MQLWAGNPAKFVRDLTEEEVSCVLCGRGVKETCTVSERCLLPLPQIAGFQKQAIEYTAMAAVHAEEFLPYGTQYLDAERIKAGESA